MGDIRSIAAAIVAACTLSACGAASQLAGATSQAVLAPVTTLAQEANLGLQTVNSTVTTMAASARATSASVATSAQTVNMAAYQAAPVTAVAPSYSAPSLSSSQKAAIDKARKSPQPELPVLPKETLDSLSVDQRGLQDAAQRTALNGPVGEMLTWDDDGRSGTALAETERLMGETTCRTFTETVTIDGNTTEGHAMACRDGEKDHWMLAF